MIGELRLRAVNRPLVACAAIGLLASVPVRAAEPSGPIVGGEAWIAYGDVTGVLVEGEPGWLGEGFGKLRSGGNGSAPSDLHVADPLFDGGIVWQPQLGWAVGATISTRVETGDHPQAGLSEAYVSWKPLGDGPVRLSGRAGLMWPPISLEHQGPEWAVADTITPSAINSWIGEEVKVAGVEFTGRAQFGDHRLALTLGGFDYNDTAGTLLTYRGWALHDRTAIAFRNQPLPPLDPFVSTIQPRHTHPLLDVGQGGFAHPGYYAKLGWDLPGRLHLEAFRYDNRADPMMADAGLEWGWRTRFDNIGVVAEPFPAWEVRAQGLSGRTQMGDEIGGVYWADMRFRAAYAMLTRRYAQGSLSVRFDAFDTTNHGSMIGTDENEDGWSATLAGKRSLTSTLSAKVEVLHVESTRNARVRTGLDPQQNQTQLQMALHWRW